MDLSAAAGLQASSAMWELGPRSHFWDINNSQEWNPTVTWGTTCTIYTPNMGTGSQPSSVKTSPLCNTYYTMLRINHKI